MSETTRDLLDTLSKVLLRCWVIGFLLNLIMFGAMLSMGDIIHSIHGQVGLSPHDSDIVMANYAGLIKALGITFFFIPWLAVRLVVNKEAKRLE
ncbi:MAG: hypothetical protein ACKVH8_01160 [Pirellulales bacterium]|jgi:hypothetical protein